MGFAFGYGFKRRSYLLYRKWREFFSTQWAGGVVLLFFVVVAMLYLDYDTVRELFNDRFYWDGNENLLLYTTASDVITAKASGKEYAVTKKKQEEDYVIVIQIQHSVLQDRLLR